MKKKIFRSIIAVAMVVLFASMLVVTSFIYQYFNSSQVNQLKEELSLAAKAVNDIGEDYFKSFNSSVFRFTVVSKDGTVLYDTEVEPDKMENHANRQEIKEALESGKGSSARSSSTLTEKTFYEAVRLNSGDVLRVSVSQLTVGALIISMLPAICAIVVIAVLISSILSNRMAKKITEPLYQLDLEHPTDNNSYEELTPVLTKIHKQHKQIKLQMEKLHRKSDEFRQIISSMSEGLVLISEKGQVLSMNTAAANIFAVKENAIGRDFLVIDRTTEMSKAVNSALSGEHNEFKAQRNGNEYQFNINPIISDDKILGAVILVFDITDKTFAERNRQEFTANVTHELKTPLQSIIGSAELLENGLVKPEDQKKFVGNIRKEAQRLVILINDIIRLSQLDENHAPATETVDLLEITKEVVEVLSASAAKKNVTLKYEGSSQTICGVHRYIYEIIYNLCDNAIRYNVDGGKVTIIIQNQDGHAALCVKDTGIGIAPEHQSRIFERFYRVDKSHSKETGGTGLGLSIVKHTVQYHGGKITLESEYKKGTTIKVLF